MLTSAAYASDGKMKHSNTDPRKGPHAAQELDRSHRYGPRGLRLSFEDVDPVPLCDAMKHNMRCIHVP